MFCYAEYKNFTGLNQSGTRFYRVVRDSAESYILATPDYTRKFQVCKLIHFKGELML